MDRGSKKRKRKRSESVTGKPAAAPSDPDLSKRLGPVRRTELHQEDPGPRLVHRACSSSRQRSAQPMTVAAPKVAWDFDLGRPETLRGQRSDNRFAG